jgi:hypothetical protein
MWNKEESWKSKEFSSLILISNLTSNSTIKLNSTSHVDAKLVGFKKLIHGSNGWLFWVNIKLSTFLFENISKV